MKGKSSHLKNRTKKYRGSKKEQTRKKRGGYYYTAISCPYIDSMRKDPRCVEVHNVPIQTVRGIGNTAYGIGNAAYQGVSSIVGYPAQQTPRESKYTYIDSKPIRTESYSKEQLTAQNRRRYNMMGGTKKRRK